MSATSLATRVTRMTALVIAASGILASAVTGIAADRFVAHEEDRRLVEAAKGFAEELREIDDDPERAEAEAAEFLYSGIHLAVYEDGRWIAGDRRLTIGTPGECSTGRTFRACNVRAGSRLAVAASSTAPAERMRLRFSLVAILTVLATTIVGASVARRLARYALEPLERLRDSVVLVAGRPDARAALGPVTGVVEVDVLHDALGDAFARLADALSRSQRFATDAAHELRTPLTALLGEIELVREDHVGDADLVQSLDRMHLAAKRLSTLVERLLVLATPRERLALSDEVELVDLLEDVRRSSTEPNRIRIDVTPGAHSRVLGDRALLGILVTNVFDNALKFAPASSVVATLRRVDDRVVLDVDDEGPGVAPADRERVFEPFERGTLDGARGYGIGLTLVAHVAAVHGGTARFVDGAIGGRLRIELPAMRISDPSPA